MRNFFIVFIAIFFFSCTSSKNKSSINDSLSFDEIDIGKDQTAVIGTAYEDTVINGQIIATLKVDSMKQGGANSLALSRGSDVRIVFTEVFQRSYLDQSGNTVKSELKDGRQVLVALKRNLRAGDYQVNFLKVK